MSISAVAESCADVRVACVSRYGAFLPPTFWNRLIRFSLTMPTSSTSRAIRFRKMLNAQMAGIASHKPTERRDERGHDALRQLGRFGRDRGMGNDGERLHHAVHRAQQAEHRADRADQGQVAEPMLEPHVFLFAHFLHGFDRLRIAAGNSRQAGREHFSQERLIVLGQLVGLLILLGVQCASKPSINCDGKSIRAARPAARS